MHAPVQAPAGGHVDVGVQVDPVLHPVEAPTTQPFCGGFGVGVAMQRPPQTIVCVQLELFGHGSPPSTQGTVGTGAGEVSMGKEVVMHAPPH